MSSPENLSIVIPVYNEGKNIKNVFQEIKQQVGCHSEILICYDFDEDNTLPHVQDLQSEFPNLRTIKNQFGAGPLGAIKSGFAAATQNVILVMMADLSDDLTCVPEALALMEQGHAVVAPSRYMKGGQQIGGPLLKRTLSRMGGITLHLLTAIPTCDPTNNFKFYARDFLQSTEIQSEGGFELALELTVKAYLKNLKIAELPTVWRDRTEGESRFQLMKWFPKYLRWYLYAIRHRWFS